MIFPFGLAGDHCCRRILRFSLPTDCFLRTLQGIGWILNSHSCTKYCCWKGLLIMRGIINLVPLSLCWMVSTRITYGRTVLILREQGEFTKLLNNMLVSGTNSYQFILSSNIYKGGSSANCQVCSLF